MSVKLHNLAQGYLHTKNLRKRVRVLKGPKRSRSTELWYKTKLLEIVHYVANTTTQSLLPVLQRNEYQWVKTKDSATVIGDGFYTDISDAIEEVAGKFGGLRGTAKRLAALAAERTKDSTDAQLAASIKQSVGIDITGALSDSAIQPVMDRAIAANVDLITSIPDQYLLKVRGAVMESIEEGLRWEDIANKIADVTSVTESRAKLIARDQVSKMNGSFNESRQTSLGIEEYQWAGSMDEREREAHAANEGKTFRWDDPPAETGHPGEDVNCRCTALPVFNLDKEEAALGIS